MPASSVPLISIIVPVRCRAGLIASTLKSIQAQTLRDWECIVVDDGSPDETAAIADRYAAADPRIQVLRQPKSGPSEARNHGFSQTHPGSKYIIFMDSDDIWLPGALRILSDALEADPAAIGVHALADEIGKDGTPWCLGEFSERGRLRYGFDDRGRMRVLALDEPTSFQNVLGTNTVYPPGLLLARRSAYERVGLFDEGLPRMQDWDMVIRLCRLGDLRFVNQVVIHYRRHTGNISGLIASDRENRRAIRALQHKTYFSPENNEAQQKIVRKVWRAWQILDIKAKLRHARQRLFSGRLIAAARLLAGAYAQVHRYVRGYPTLTGI